MSVSFWSCPTSLARQLRATHQKFVDRSRALPAFTNRPHDERLPPTHVAGSKNLRHGCSIVFDIGRDVASCVTSCSQLLEQAGLNRPEEAHREKHEIGFQFEF